MKIIIYGENKEAKELYNNILSCIEELGLSDFIPVEATNNISSLNISINKEPALIVQEESIDFTDVIFEGILPSNEEIKSIIIKIIGGDCSGTCDSGSCNSCLLN